MTQQINGRGGECLSRNTFNIQYHILPLKKINKWNKTYKKKVEFLNNNNNNNKKKNMNCHCSFIKKKSFSQSLNCLKVQPVGVHYLSASLGYIWGSTALFRKLGVVVLGWRIWQHCKRCSLIRLLCSVLQDGSGFIPWLGSLFFAHEYLCQILKT